MRVKVGDQWFTAEPGRPIAIELTSADRKNITNVAEWATLYDQGQFHDDDSRQMPADVMRGGLAD